MVRVVAFIPDLLFGSNVIGSLRAAGHEPVLVGDLTFEAAERIEHVRMLRPPGVATLAFYAHVESEVRARAEEAGFDLVIPRSRMAREGAALVDRLLSA